MQTPIFTVLVMTMLVTSVEMPYCFAQTEPSPSQNEADVLSAPVHTTYRSGTSAKIPFEWVNGEIVVTATIAGVSELKLIVDTGIVNSCLGAESVMAARFPRGSTSYAVRGVGSDVLSGRRGQNISMVMAGMTISPAPMLIVSGQSFSAPMGMHIDGYVGYDILKNYVVKIDYIDNTIEFSDSLGPDTSRTGLPVPVTIENGRIYVTAVIRNNGVDSAPTPFLMDTGCTIGMVLFRQFLRDNPRLTFPGGVEREMQGIGGPLIVEAAPCAELRFGNAVLPDPYVQIMEHDPAGFASFTGLIGNQIWRHFDVTIDFPGKRLFLKKSALLDNNVRYIQLNSD